MYQRKILKVRKMGIVLCLALSLNMVGCAGTKTNTASETSGISDEVTTENGNGVETVSTDEASETTAEKISIEDKNILKVLENKKKYFNTEFNDYRYLKDYSSGNYMVDNNDGKYEYCGSGDDNSYNLSVDNWCQVDMDSDGNKEVVLETKHEIVLVLHSEKDKVYCYAFRYRGMKSIKTDGSFAGSSSTANTYIGKIRFANGECYYDEMCADDELDDDNQVYRINKKNVSKEEVKAFLEKQEKKEDVLWLEGYPTDK